MNIGATLIATTVLAILYERFGSQTLLNNLLITERGIDLGIRKMWAERGQIDRSLWNTFTAAARHEVWLFGIAEAGYADDNKFHRIVSEGVALKCHYRFLLLDPSSEAAKKIDGMQGGAGAVQGSINHALGQFRAMQTKNMQGTGSIEIRIYSEIPHVSIVRSDNELLVTQYLWHRVGDSSFTYLLQEVRDGIFQQYMEYFEEMWKNAQPV